MGLTKVFYEAKVNNFNKSAFILKVQDA